MTATQCVPEEEAAGAIALELERLMRLHLSHSFKDALKPAQWDALRYFARSAAAQRSITAFARHRATTLGTASSTVSSLVDKGLLLRDYGNGIPRNLKLRVSGAGLARLEHDPIAIVTAQHRGAGPGHPSEPGGEPVNARGGHGRCVAGKDRRVSSHRSL